MDSSKIEVPNWLLENPEYKIEYDTCCKKYNFYLYFHNCKVDRERKELEASIKQDSDKLFHYHMKIMNNLIDFSLDIDSNEEIFHSMKETFHIMKNDAFAKFKNLVKERRKVLEEKLTKEKAQLDDNFLDEIYALELKYNLNLDCNLGDFDKSWLEGNNIPIPKKPKYIKYESSGYKIAVRKRQLKIEKAQN